jgi:hypothetical protein
MDRPQSSRYSPNLYQKTSTRRWERGHPGARRAGLHTAFGRHVRRARTLVTKRIPYPIGFVCLIWVPEVPDTATEIRNVCAPRSNDDASLVRYLGGGAPSPFIIFAGLSPRGSG